MEFTVGLQEINRGQISLVGGKAVNLGELTKVDGIIVPTGFCVTTHAFVASMAQSPDVAAAVDRLDALPAGNGAATAQLAASIRRLIEQATVAGAIVESISECRAQGCWKCSLRGSLECDGRGYANRILCWPARELS